MSGSGARSKVPADGPFEYFRGISIDLMTRGALAIRLHRLSTSSWRARFECCSDVLQVSALSPENADLPLHMPANDQAYAAA
ncbi:hypothetical protein NJ75_04506 [Novosphingobium subterraneum]|jgi:hypothetical protein|uniref:Uncharacterized protein n=1 Tax=Novosphingobium subterraneum TaxID=48936 RepID=A0A0B8ZU28_9SPHN|nr:hypothetical protein NJ75_04506 [Novosphingobium subterraneum]